VSRTIADIGRDRITRGLIGREAELEALDGLIREQRAFVAYVHGVAGVGKSSLVAAFAAKAREGGAQVVSLDGRTIEPTDRGFLRGLSKALGIASDSMDGIVARLAALGGRTVIVVDHYEVLRLLDTWFRQDFVPCLPDSARVVFAGREAPVAGWLTSPHLVDAVQVMSLGPLEPGAAIELLRQQGVPEPSVAELERIAHGHPLALKLAAAAVAERPGLAPSDVAGPRVLEELTRLYLSDVQDPLTRRAIEAAAVVRRTTTSLIAGLLPDVAPQDAFDRLRALPFVEMRSDGLVIHEAIQAQVAAFLRASDPVRHRELRRTAWHLLRDEVRHAGPEQLWRYTADMLYLIENPVVREAFFPSGAQPLAIEPARSSDLPCVEVERCRSEANSCTLPPTLSTSTGLSRWPPVTTTFFAPSLCRAAAAARICSTLVTAMPASAPASSMFGVMMVASGRSSFRIFSTPLLSSSGSPEEEVITGSSTTLGILLLFRKSTTAATPSLEPSMPMRTAAKLKSVASSFSVSRISLPETASERRTPCVDWTVNAVTQPTP